MARMALAGQPQDAIKHARRALALNRNAGDKNEEANSLRLIADAAFKLEEEVKVSGTVSDVASL